jgi:hypothetical protein
MVLNPEILQKARESGARLQEAERQALLSRADYHTAIRRLHLAGGSLREIAQALSLSHQRVQQIVSGMGGSWWRRVWRARSKPADAVCTWCGRPPSEVAKLIAGPDVFICESCIVCAEKTASASKTVGPFSQTRRRGLTHRCAFCGRIAHRERSVVIADAGDICVNCLRSCREILEASAS